ncbi:MAG: type II toxin-antitoxin system VapC family toxin [Candidatus Baldrarchaeia archaeon]
MRIVDTVYLVAYFRSSDRLHGDAIRVIEGLGGDTVVSQAALLEFDLLMKARGFSDDERRKVWLVLHRFISRETVEPVTPLDMAVAAVIIASYGLDYFDALVAAQCVVRGAEPLTTDKEILGVVSRRGEVLSELERYGIVLP